MMRLVLAFYDAGLDALKQGADINDIVKLPVREQIGRYKYTGSCRPFDAGTGR